MKQVDDTWETADEIFYKAKLEANALNVDNTGETAREIFYKAEPKTKALNVDDKDPETREELTNSHDQNTMNAETQTAALRVKIAQNAETQTQFEYLFKQAVLQPFTEEYFVNHDDRVRFYIGFPGFDVLIATFPFISPFVTQRSKSLSLFQEFIMVLMKLKLNVLLQDLAYRFGISLTTVSRNFSTQLKVMDIRLSPSSDGLNEMSSGTRCLSVFSSHLGKKPLLLTVLRSS